MYRYETHSHTFPVSRCAKVSAQETVRFYKKKGYDGIFITNHFIEGNTVGTEKMSYEQKIEVYFSDYEEALREGKRLEIKVFCGIETTNGGTDFLVYGLGKEWYLRHPEIDNMIMSQRLSFFKEHGALIIQAHPFREAGYIDHIRLYPRHIEGVEVINANRTEFENEMARMYAEKYGLLGFAGSDNHTAGKQRFLAGMQTERPVNSEKEFVEAVRKGQAEIFTLDNEQ
ncbi:MAG: PHP domain-containing protein [Clostridia bacterium]|nr:PHP domain-containing protein [Clostridia bacterium]